MINAIFAVDQNGGMGYNGTLPWPHNKEDMIHFANLTTNNVVVMGRRTWDDPKMPKPLKGRSVYVATHKPVMYAQPFSGDLEENLLRIEESNPSKIIYVVGGVKLLEAAHPLLDRIYITYFKGAYRHDTRMNIKDYISGFRVRRAEVSKDFQSVFTVYESIFRRAPKEI